MKDKVFIWLLTSNIFNENTIKDYDVVCYKTKPNRPRLIKKVKELVGERASVDIESIVEELANTGWYTKLSEKIELELLKKELN